MTFTIREDQSTQYKDQLSQIGLETKRKRFLRDYVVNLWDQYQVEVR